MRIDTRKLLGPLAVLILISAAVYGAKWLHGDFAAPTVSYTDYEGHVLVSADGRTLTVAGNLGYCGSDNKLDMKESSSQVALRLRHTFPPLGSRSVGTCSARMPEILSGRLQAPLGTRTLVDADHRSPLTWFDGNLLLRPPGLGPRWTLRYAAPWITNASSQLMLNGCTQVWDSRTGLGELTLTQAFGSLSDLTFPGNAPHSPGIAIHVRGHTGVALDTSIKWTEGHQVMRLTGTFATASLTLAQLLAILGNTPTQP